MLSGSEGELREVHLSRPVAGQRTARNSHKLLAIKAREVLQEAGITSQLAMYQNVKDLPYPALGQTT